MAQYHLIPSYFATCTYTPLPEHLCTNKNVYVYIYSLISG